jgi:hypothetical protein
MEQYKAAEINWNECLEQIFKTVHFIDKQRQVFNDIKENVAL